VYSDYLLDCYPVCLAKLVLVTKHFNMRKIIGSYPNRLFQFSEAKPDDRIARPENSVQFAPTTVYSINMSFPRLTNT